MTYEEALASLIDDGIKLGAGDYIPMETLEVCKEALEKQIPQKPYKVGVRDYECPKCHKFLHVVGYPCRCGQMIDWRGEE